MARKVQDYAGYMYISFYIYMKQWTENPRLPKDSLAYKFAEI